ncbi:MAG: cell division protein ZapA [Pseudomonadota bacterium]
MAEVNVTIANKQYSIACDDGQEQRVVDLASQVDGRMREIAAMGGGATDAHLLVLNSIMMADELSNAANNNSSQPIDGLTISQEDETAITNAIDQMAARINAIAANIQAH